MSLKSMLLRHTGRSILTKTFVCVDGLSLPYPVAKVDRWPYYMFINLPVMATEVRVAKMPAAGVKAP